MDFKAAYDTIIRIEVYVGMSDLNSCEQRKPSPRCQILDALSSRQAEMERSSSTGLNQVLVVVPHK
jgi:hypothetical protein